MTTNENILKITGKVSLLEPLELGHNYKIDIEGSVTSTSDHDNHNGTLDKEFKFEPVLVRVIKETGETIKTKDPRKFTQKLRGLAYRFWEDDTSADPDFEAYYQSIGKQILLELDEIINRAKRK